MTVQNKTTKILALTIAITYSGLAANVAGHRPNDDNNRNGIARNRVTFQGMNEVANGFFDMLHRVPDIREARDLPDADRFWRDFRWNIGDIWRDFRWNIRDILN